MKPLYELRLRALERNGARDRDRDRDRVRDQDKDRERERDPDRTRLEADATGAQPDDATFHLMREFATFLVSIDDYAGAAPLLSRLLAFLKAKKAYESSAGKSGVMTRRSDPELDAELCDMDFNLGIALQHMGDYNTAKPHMQNALQVRCELNCKWKPLCRLAFRCSIFAKSHGSNRC